MFLLGTLLSAHAQVPSYVPSNGLVGWWPFNGNANDESGKGNNLKLYGDASFTQDRFSKNNSAITLDGNDDYVASINSLLNFSNDFTISIWFKLKSLSSQGTPVTDRCLFNTFPNADHAIEVWSYQSSQTSSGKNSAGYIGNGSSWYATPTVQYNMNLSIDSWYNWVLVKENNVRKVYLSDKLIFQTSSSYNGPNKLTGIIFGAMCGGPTWPDWEFNGNFDDIGLWNRALSSTEVHKLSLSCIKSITQQPTNQGMFAGNATFTCATNDTLVNYQWQTNSGTGWNNLFNAGQYTGSNSNSLLVSNVTLSNNNQLFRCIIKGDCLTDTTSEVSLRVWGLGVQSEQVQAFKVYPNPTKGQVTIENGDIAKMIGYAVSIYNSIGQQVFQSNITQQQFSLDISQLGGNGLYFMELTDNNGNIVDVKKIVLQ